MEGVVCIDPYSKGRLLVIGHEYTTMKAAQIIRSPGLRGSLLAR